MRLILVLILLLCPAAAQPNDAIRAALDRMYRLDFAAGQRILDEEISRHPSAPLPQAFRAAGCLFYELDRLQVLQSGFLTDDKQIASKKALRPDPEVQRRFRAASAEARRLAAQRLVEDPQDRDALFAQVVVSGAETDYTALVEKRLAASLTFARESQSSAMRLLRLHPDFADAYLTTGLSEYLLASVPFFVRWFVKFEGTQGSKQAALRNLEIASAQGRYLAPFARMLLATLYLREKRPQACYQLLESLARDYPENPMFRRELTKVGRLVERTAGD